MHMRSSAVMQAVSAGSARPIPSTQQHCGERGCCCSKQLHSQRLHTSHPTHQAAFECRRRWSMQASSNAAGPADAGHAWQCCDCAHDKARTNTQAVCARLPCERTRTHTLPWRTKQAVESFSTPSLPTAMHIHTHRCTQSDTHTGMQTHPHAHIHTYTHIHTHTQAHTHTPRRCTTHQRAPHAAVCTHKGGLSLLETRDGAVRPGTM
jgi:hypothetical protein